MTENAPERRPADDPVNVTDIDWEEAGLPEQEDTTEDQPLPTEEPVAMEEHGTRGTDKEAGEPHEQAVARERGDVDAPGEPPQLAEPEHAGEEGTPEPAARLVAEDEGVRADTEKDLAADDVSADRGALSSEEDAVRVRTEDEEVP